MKYQLHIGDALTVLRTMPDQSANCCVTSPPYWGLRDYGVEGQLGLEKPPEEYVSKLVEIFREVRRVLCDDGTLWLNLGDSYAGSGKGRNADGSHYEGGKQGTSRGTIDGKLCKIETPDGLKQKDLVGIPWMVAFALRADGWYLRQDIIWHKPNPMPESVRDRCTKAHEYIFMLSKSARYYYDKEAIKEPSVMRPQNRNTARSEHPKGDEGRGLHVRPEGGTSYESRNKRSVWTVSTKPFSGAHFATFPPDLIEPCILAGCPESGTVLDPFAGSGTTGEVALKHFRRFVGVELNPTYANEIAIPRIAREASMPKQISIFV